MFPRKALDLIILSILNDNPEGLSGYSLVMKIKEFFPITNVSPGTIYPKLKKLSDANDIKELEKIYQITDQGKQRLQESTPKIIDDTLSFMPKLYKILIGTLPFNKRMNYMSDIPSCFHFGAGHEYDETIFSKESVCSSNISGSLKHLTAMKEKLEESKIRIQQQADQRLQHIEKRLKAIQQKIDECNKEKEQWTKIPIVEDD
ncbi:PadR family transcriptional regulator [Candidatus Lokiarchaeum ossiferum]|uniref:PadR family transcriptional regulator n=1 Tax=Candidatus Lokiarchaeum ossiferum TaxID=2951803 RepID=UPI00352CD43F